MPLLSLLKKHPPGCRHASLFSPILLFCILLVSSPSYGESASQLFNQAADFFEQGQYQKAARYFELARQQGIKSPALLYNLASSYYKLKRYDLAEKYYLQVRRYPKMRALAEYNLALTAEKQQQKAKSRRWLESVINSKQSPALVKLARKKLGSQASHSRDKTYSVYTNLSLGQDDNINISELTATSLSDSFNQLLIAGNYRFMGERPSGWFADLSYYQRQYSTETLYDNSELTLGISKRQKLSNWSLKYALQQSRSTYGGADYQTILRLNIYAYYRLGRYQKLNFSYRYNDIRSETTSTALQGSRQYIKAEYRRYHRHHRQKFSYELELNNREDSISSSFSPSRHRLRYQYSHYFDNGWLFNGALGLRQSDYPTVAGVQRSDTRIRATLSGAYRFDKTLRLQAKYTYTDNQSNVPVDSYSKQLVTLSLIKLF